MAGEIIFACMDWLLAEALTARGVKNVYSYTWNAPDTVLYNVNPYLGAMHTSDLYYLFDGTNTIPNAGNTFRAFNTSEAALSREAIGYWTSFASTGNPSAQKVATSPVLGPFAPGADVRQRMVLTRGGDTVTSSAMEQISDAEIERCQFWMSEDVVVETLV